MSNPPRYTTTLFKATPTQPGSSFQNPLRSIGVDAHPEAKRFYILDREQGITQVIALEAKDYRDFGYGIFDSYGNQARQFEIDHDAKVIEYTTGEADEYFYQIDGVWETVVLAQMMADAATDESIHYERETGHWYRKEKTIDSSEDNPKEDEQCTCPPDNPDTAADANSGSPMT
jgi:hypothetical protein